MLLRRSCGGRVLLCTNHCQVTDNIHLLNTEDNTDANGASQVIGKWSCPCIKGEMAALSDCPAHSHPAETSALTQTQTAQSYHLSHAETKGSQDLKLINRAFTPLTQTPRSLLESIERGGACPTSHLSFIGVIQRVFSKTNRKYDPTQTVSPGNPRRVCSLLVQDMCGFIAELLLPPGCDVKEPWQSCVVGQGKVYTFSGIRVQQRLNPNKCPKLFSMIKSVWRPDAVMETSEISQESSQASIMTSTHAPTFSYTLVAPPGESSCHYMVDYDGSALFTKRPLEPVGHILEGKDSGDLCRVHLRGRVVFHQVTDSGRKKFVYIVSSGSSLGCLQVAAADWLVSDNHTWDPAKCYEFYDVLICQGVFTLDEYSSVQMSDWTPPISQLSSGNDITETALTNLLPFSGISQKHNLCQIQGEISGAEESTAYSWMACPVCDSDKLQGGTAQRPFLFCQRCQRGVPEPRNKMNLEVYVRYPALASVKVKLLQQTIESLLHLEVEEEGYDMQAILGKTLGSMAAVVTSRNKPKDDRPLFELSQVSLQF